MYRSFFFVLALVLCSTPTTASDAIRAAVEKRQPNAQDVTIRPTPIPGVSEVSIGMQVLYMSEDGAFALAGPLLSLADGANLTEQRLAQARQAALDRSTVSMFHYPADTPKHSVTVFTDIDCPHCRRFHNEVPAMQAAGIDIRYVLLPRAGKGSASYQKSINAACAADPEASITRAMTGKQPAEATCSHPIDGHLALSRALNVSSTPSIVMDDGQLILGYHNAERLLKVIAQRKVK
ncbi:MAG: DsbC family protein [Pseudomonadota bacterium]